VLRRPPQEARCAGGWKWKFRSDPRNKNPPPTHRAAIHHAATHHAAKAVCAALSRPASDCWIVGHTSSAHSAVGRPSLVDQYSSLNRPPKAAAAQAMNAPITMDRAVKIERFAAALRAVSAA
jgi:hypothetical protein